MFGFTYGGGGLTRPHIFFFAAAHYNFKKIQAR